MGRGDNRLTAVVLRKRAQRKKKLRMKRKMEQVRLQRQGRK